MRFEIEAEDDSGSIDITLDDREARTILFKTAYEIEEEILQKKLYIFTIMNFYKFSFN